MMQDLKTGFMLGGRPVKQQLVQFCVTWIGAILAMGAIYILWKMGPVVRAASERVVPYQPPKQAHYGNHRCC